LGRLQLETDAATFKISGQQFSCEVNRQNGQLGNLRLGGQTLLVGGPGLMILPLENGPCEPRDLTQFGACNQLCNNSRASSVTAKPTEDGGVSVKVADECDDAKGNYTLTFEPDGRLDLDYSFRALKAVNPRQAGMVFFLPRDCDTLRWERRAEWSAYPPDHIGRPVGEARANANQITNFCALVSAPKGPWSQDANMLGTADFRSTKSRLCAASLQNPRGAGIFLQADGAQSARAFVDGDRIGWLVACINAGGAEGFFATHHAGDRHPLNPGDPLPDTVHLRLIQP
jgi:hypothetical protein